MLGPTSLRERFMSELNMDLSVKEVALLMKKFDPINIGKIKLGISYIFRHEL